MGRLPNCDVLFVRLLFRGYEENECILLSINIVIYLSLYVVQYVKRNQQNNVLWLLKFVLTQFPLGNPKITFDVWYNQCNILKAQFELGFYIILSTLLYALYYTLLLYSQATRVTFIGGIAMFQDFKAESLQSRHK